MQMHWLCHIGNAFSFGNVPYIGGHFGNHYLSKVFFKVSVCVALVKATNKDDLPGYELDSINFTGMFYMR